MKKVNKKKVFKFKSKVVVWAGGNYNEAKKAGAWRMAFLPKDIGAKISEIQKGKKRRGWGAVYVNARVGKSIWKTSIFPDKRSSTYILPLKKEIRYEENLYDDATFDFIIEI